MLYAFIQANCSSALGMIDVDLSSTSPTYVNDGSGESKERAWQQLILKAKKIHRPETKVSEL